MSTAFTVSVRTTDAVLLAADNVSGLTRAKAAVELSLIGAGLRIRATDWRRGVGGAWFIARPDCRAELTPTRIFVPTRKLPLSETR